MTILAFWCCDLLFFVFSLQGQGIWSEGPLQGELILCYSLFALYEHVNFCMAHCCNFEVGFPPYLFYSMIPFRDSSSKIIESSFEMLLPNDKIFWYILMVPNTSDTATIISFMVVGLWTWIKKAGVCCLTNKSLVDFRGMEFHCYWVNHCRLCQWQEVQ